MNDSRNKSKKEVNIEEVSLNRLHLIPMCNQNPSDIALYKERMKLLGTAASELDQTKKEIFTLKDIKVFSNAEVCNLTGLAVSAIKSRALRSRLKIKQKIRSCLRLKGVRIRMRKYEELRYWTATIF